MCLLFLVRQNFEHKHRTKVFVMNVTDELADWEDSRNMNRKRQWFTIDDALQQLALHKPVQRRYLQQLKNSRNNFFSDTTTTPTSATATNQSNLSSSTASNNTTTTSTTIQQSTSEGTAAAI